MKASILATEHISQTEGNPNLFLEFKVRQTVPKQVKG